MGICAGHQFMAGHYGGRAAEAPAPEFGAATINLVDGGGPLFAETPDTQTVWESHNDEVVELPEGFRITVAASHVKFKHGERRIKSIRPSISSRSE